MNFYKYCHIILSQFDFYGVSNAAKHSLTLELSQQSIGLFLHIAVLTLTFEKSQLSDENDFFSKFIALWSVSNNILFFLHCANIYYIWTITRYAIFRGACLSSSGPVSHSVWVSKCLRVTLLLKVKKVKKKVKKVKKIKKSKKKSKKSQKKSKNQKNQKNQKSQNVICQSLSLTCYMLLAFLHFLCETCFYLQKLVSFRSLLYVS